jgi:hypothetical protein
VASTVRKRTFAALVVPHRADVVTREPVGELLGLGLARYVAECCHDRTESKSGCRDEG